MEVSGKSDVQRIPNLIKLETGYKADRTPGGSAADAAWRNDKVVLSPKAREINDAKQKLMNMPDIRQHKVGDIRNQINSGTYVVKGDKVAFHMLKESVLNQRISA